MPNETDDSVEQDGPGMLTKAQREYLYGDSDIEEGTQRERTTRARIRKRLTNGIHDLALALLNLEGRDIEQVRISFRESGELNVLHSATGRMLMLSSLPPEKAIPNEADREIQGETTLSMSTADYTVDVLPDEVQTHFFESIQRMHRLDSDSDWTVRDSKLTSTVGFDEDRSKSVQATELRRLITRYESGEISRSELMIELSKRVPENDEQKEALSGAIDELRRIDSDQ